MSDSIRVELPERFILTALDDLKSMIEPGLRTPSCVILDGSAVATVDSAALQFILMVQHAVDALQENEGDALSVLHSPSQVLNNALQEIGVVTSDADVAANEG